MPGVEIRQVKVLPDPGEILYTASDGDTGDGYPLMRVGRNGVSYLVPGVGSFYVVGGDRLFYTVEPGADPDWVQLWLSNQVLVALLHQRGIISFHAGSFVYGGRGVLVTGATGAGKTSLTLAFALNGAGFLTDDLTPVVFRGGRPLIMPLHRRVKIRPDTARMPGIDQSRLTDAERGTGKLYLDVPPVTGEHTIDMILKIETGDVAVTTFAEPTPAERFALLRSEVCSWEMLAGMPETEAAYLQQIVDIISRTRLYKVTRPAGITPAGFYGRVRSFIDSEQGGGSG